ncbi:hypothetical protein ACF0H5_013937 [Mactra antiquata]
MNSSRRRSLTPSGYNSNTGLLYSQPLNVDRCLSGCHNVSGNFVRCTDYINLRNETSKKSCTFTIDQSYGNHNMTIEEAKIELINSAREIDMAYLSMKRKKDFPEQLNHPMRVTWEDLEGNILHVMMNECTNTDYGDKLKVASKLK